MKTNEPIPALALDDLLHMAASAIEDLLEHTDPNTNYYSGLWADVPGKLRAAAMLQAGNSPVIPESCSAKFGNFQHYWHSKGYVLVPTEPTESMCDISHIGVDVYCGITDDNEYYSIGGAEAAKVWKAMLAAAPQEVPDGK